MYEVSYIGQAIFFFAYMVMKACSVWTFCKAMPLFVYGYFRWVCQTSFQIPQYFFDYMIQKTFHIFIK